MHQSLKTRLLLSSIVCLLFSSCAISKYKKLSDCKSTQSQEVIIPVLIPNKTTKFKTTIDVLKNHLTGIVLVKQTDSLTTHIVFVTELGMKMFDFEVKGDDVKAVYVFEPLNKPVVIKALKENFKNMLMFNFKDKPTQQCLIANKNITVFYPENQNKEKMYLRSLTIQFDKNLVVPYLIDSQEIFNGKKLSSAIEYTYSKDKYEKITAKQFGLVKFYFELINITE